MNDDIWKMFTKLYLVSSKPTISRCYEDTQQWIKHYYPELYNSIPSERTFRRRVKNEIPGCVIEYTREGRKSCFDKYCEYIERDYTDLKANEIWIADNHTLDVISMTPEGKPHRLSLTAYMDAKSGVIVGWNLCDNPCSQSTLLAFRAAVLNGFGIPWGVYFDNGSEFLTHDIAGRGHRTKSSWNAEDTPPTILSLLDVTMVNALVTNAKAKNIERYFYTFKEYISKAFSGYCGGTILERPEDLSKQIKKGNIPTDKEIRELLAVLINGGYNCRKYGGKEPEYKGMTRIDVWNDSINSGEVVFRDAADDDLTLLLARTSRYQKIKRNGVFIDTAPGEYLDAKASEYGVTRHAAVPAKYYADITGTVPQTGERFFYNGRYFALKQTDDGVYYLEAEIPGILLNLTGSSAVPVNNIPGLSSCKFGGIMEYGAEEENDEGLRLRLKDKISNPGECGNKQHYKAWCESVEGVGTARIIPLWNGPNTVKGILINTEGLPCGGETVSRVQDYVDPGGTGLGEGAACIGSHFTAVSAKPFAVDISVALELQSGEDEYSIKLEIESAVKEYFKRLAVSGGDTVVRISEIGSEIGKISRIVDYGDLRINGGISNISVDFESVPVLGVIEIEILQ